MKSVIKHSLALLTSLAMMSLSQSSWAGEGFHDDPTQLPATVRAAWDSVFIAKPIHNVAGIASAVLVGKEQVGADQYYLTFISNDHVIRDICGDSLGYCDNLELSASKVVEVDARRKSIVREVSTKKSNLTVRGIEVIRKSTNPDLALVRVLVTGSQYANLRPLRPTQDCGAFKRDQQVYVIGYPIVAERPNFNVEHKNFVLKRWSTGYLVTNTTGKNEVDGSTEHHTASTADSLIGNSGGATINLSGELIGIHSGSPSQAYPGYPYLGDESTNPKKPHAMFVRCEYLDDFINMRPVSLDPADYYKKPREASPTTSPSRLKTNQTKS